MAIEAVIFDWGGTLTPWHAIDFAAEAQALALAAVGGDHTAAELLARANQEVWGWSRDHQRSARVSDIFEAAGLRHDEGMLTAYREFWDPHTLTDPDAHDLLRRLRADGVKIGVLSNTVWPAAWHEEIFRRDDLLDLIDGAVYSSEIAHTKPAPQAFDAAMRAVGVDEPSRCVFVGDRLFEDVWGAGTFGMRTILIPHSDIPSDQAGHSEGEPDAVVRHLSEVYDVVRMWRSS